MRASSNIYSPDETTPPGTMLGTGRMTHEVVLSSPWYYTVTLLNSSTKFDMRVISENGDAKVFRQFCGPPKALNFIFYVIENTKKLKSKKLKKQISFLSVISYCLS